MLKVILFKFNQNSPIHQKDINGRTQIVVDVQGSPLSESIHLQASHLSESSPLLEAPTIVALEASLQRELDMLWGCPNEAENFTICRKPHNICQGNKILFEPSVISIGPFHRGRKQLRALEEEKLRFLRDFLSRADHISLDLCISEMKLLETRTRRCYSETFDDLDSNSFVKMMLLDGCFIVEYFLKVGKVNFNYSRVIYRDLLLLENQIPFFIVEKLYDIGHLNQVVDRMLFVKNFGCSFFSLGLTKHKDSMFSNPPAEIPDPTADLNSKIPNPPDEIHHLLHLCYHYIVPNPEKPVVLCSIPFDLTTMFSTIKGLLTRRFPHSTSHSLSVALPNFNWNMSSMVIPSATELNHKGMKFMPKSNPKHLMDISFEYGVLKIPTLTITNDNKPILANLVAFEHFKYGKPGSPLTRFVEFWDNLVNTQNDVKILQRCGIVENWLGSEEEVTHFINQFTEVDIFQGDHYLAIIYLEVNRYIESNWNQSTWNRQKAKLIRDYFSSPWKTISLVVGFILLVLTFVQSLYAVYAYYIPPSS